MQRGWRLFAASATSWALADLHAAAREASTGSLLPIPAPPGALAAGALVLSVLAVLAFLQASVSSTARMRIFLDALLIAAAMLFIGWLFVLGPLFEANDAGPAGMLALASPLADLVLVSLALVAATRATGSSSRAGWALLSTGLALLAVGDSGSAYLQVAGLATSDSVDTFPWVLGALLVALAAVALEQPVPAKAEDEDVHTGTRFQVFLPYVPVFMAAGAALSRAEQVPSSSFLLANAAVILALLLTRQLVGQIENLDLAKELDTRVRDRTADLARKESQFRALVQNASDVVTLIDATGVIRYQSASSERVLGYSFSELVGLPVTQLFHDEAHAAVTQRLHVAPAPPSPPASFQVPLRRSDGSWILTENTLSNLLDHDAVRGIVLTSRDITGQRALEEQLRDQALHDPLTGLGNRAMFRDRLDHAIARTSRRPEQLAVLLLDLDGFKGINDGLGHEAGDRLLIEVGRRLEDALRTGDSVARMGGDEFAILLEDTRDEGAAVVAQRILFRLRAPIDVGEKSVVVQGSIGVAIASSALSRADELLRNADLAMYVAKARGKGTFALYEDGMREEAQRRIEVENDLRRGLHAGELTMHYQPVVQLPSGHISGVEALVRWHHPERGMVAPNEFIPVAEESDLILLLGRFVLRESCRQAKAFQRSLPTGRQFTVAVNVATRQLLNGWLVKEVKTALAESELDPASLVLEITEGALTASTEDIEPVLSELRATGVQIAIDDFGTGYSSLSRLRSLPIDKLKIDISFVREIAGAEDEAPIVAAIIAMAHSLHLTTVAEGVEHADQLACLHQLACDEVQGFVLSRPLPADALLALLSDPEGLLDGPVEAEPLSEAQRGFADVVADATAGDPTGGGAAVTAVLEELCRLTEADSVYLTRIDWDELTQEICEVRGNGRISVATGDRMPWPGSPCWRAMQGDPRLLGDLAAELPDDPLVGAGVASHLTVPVHLPDGGLYGTLCAASAERVRFTEAMETLLELFARVLVDHVASAPTAFASSGT
jgi:diguanylate cyclase (GGDEF)-like protein/PAS domain S-box-containing protein